jgi:hypothetical protein
LKKNKFNIICAWALLVCFAAGQYMVYVHQHKILQRTRISQNISKSHSKPVVTVSEKCYMCDAMHHDAVTPTQHNYFSPIVVSGHIYKVGYYNFKSIALILSADRGPPAGTYTC